MLQTHKIQTAKLTSKTFRLSLLYTSVIIYLFMAFISLSSCSSDDSVTQNTPADPDLLLTEPSITLLEGSEALTRGVIGAPGFGNMNHTIKAEATEGFVELVIYQVVNGVQSEYQTIDTSHPDYVENSNAFTYELDYIFTEDDLDNEMYFIAKVLDVENQTVSLNFAEATVKQPLKYVEQIFMETRIPLQPNNMQIAQYLSINGDEIGGVNLNTVIDEDLHSVVEAIISYSEEQGAYLSSTTAVDNWQSVDNIAYLSTTKFKNLSPEVTSLDAYDVYDTFVIEELYENATFGPDEEKLDIEQYIVFALRTDDGRTALFEITYFEVINNSEVYLGMNMYITQ